MTTSATIAVWALTGVLLLLAVVIAAVGYVWATTSHLDRPITEADLRVDDWFAWPTLDSEPENPA
jgi:hypothetical protein